MYRASGRLLWAGALLCSAATSVSTAAQDVLARKPALHWARAPGAESCIGPAELARGVEQIVGPVFQSPSSADVTLETTVSRTRNGFSLLAHVLDARGAELGSRTLAAAGSNCRALDALWMFVLALMLDPHAALLALPPELEAQLEGGAGAALLAELRNEAAAEADAAPDPLQVEPGPAAAAPSAPSALDAAPRAIEPPLILRAQLAAGPAYGVGPALSAALALGLELERTWWMLRTRLSSWLPRSTRIDDDPAHTARFAGAQLHLLACPSEFVLKALRADICAGGFLGLLHGRAEGVAQAQSSLRPTYGPALEGRLSWPFSTAWALAVGASVQWNARRDRFYVASGDTASQRGFRLPEVGAGAWLALVWTARGAPGLSR